ncbi:MAG: archease [Candidatus Parvarchaeota archaeon]|nr:archease [Candidatus Parvarchaeota archaeon]
MGYRFIENLSIADVAFEAHGENLNELFVSSAEALENTMVRNIEKVKPETTREFGVSSNKLDLLLVEFLQKLISYKDTDQLIFSKFTVNVKEIKNDWRVRCRAEGEHLDPNKHDLVVDVKAATMHMLKVQKKDEEWTARVVLDV